MKNKQPTGCSLNELAALIASATQPAPDKIPAGWFTRMQLQKQWGCGETKAQQRIQSAIKAGKVQRRMFAVVDATGACRPIPHYSLASQ